ncbi:DUF948 domain-containing protein [Merismopedia glauca]|uniref:DUF948 domain-containing protein n=1 Tax=Merismopedia glauca CCAP 1448/3 TaxID=1296344 RepID=A0A2T1C5F5_9CYAN|nr:DUF948 domain-containing protein [Merismopedia glauca]PSB03499.1 hypothetical protein C7B64_08005 [Merismopedia glauca CCAP 1448/3]
MTEPIFWLGLSILLVAASLTAVLVAALPALQELARAARSAEKLFDTLNRELPPTLEAIRLTGLEISDLTDEVNEGVKSATQVVKQVDRSVVGAKQQAQKVQVGTRSLWSGVKAAWKTFNAPNIASQRELERLPPSKQTLPNSLERLPKTRRPSDANRLVSHTYPNYSANDPSNYVEEESNDSEWEDYV